VAEPLKHLFWDSCVFCAYLFEESVHNPNHIEQYLSESVTSKEPKWKIYTSSLIYTEIMDSQIKKKGVGSLTAFLADLEGSVILIDPNPPVLQLAGRLKDIRYRKGESDRRRLTTGDAIMLATCLYAQDVLGVTFEAFHTLDDGRKKEVPLLSYHEWCEGLIGAYLRLAQRVCALNRQRPVHPEPMFDGMTLSGTLPTPDDIKH
jgi:predicted nucleic acid-binding protein